MKIFVSPQRKMCSLFAVQNNKNKEFDTIRWQSLFNSAQPFRSVLS